MTQEALQAGQANDFGGVIDDIDIAEITPEDRGDTIVEETVEPANDNTPTPEPVEETQVESEKAEEPTETPEEVAESTDNVTEETEAEPEEEKAKGHKVPVSRLNKEVEKRREAENKFEALQKQLDELQSQVNAPQAEAQPETPAEPEYDVTGKMQEAMTLAMDGDLEKSAELMAEVIAKSNDQAVKQATQQSEQQYNHMSTAEKEQAMLTAKAGEIVAAYPVFDSASESFDAAMTEELKEYRDAFFAKGYMAHEALEKAKDTVVKLHGVQSVTEQSLPPKVEKKDVKKAVDAAIKTPPKTSGDLDTEKAVRRIEEYTEEEFEKLTPAELKKLRGDF